MKSVIETLNWTILSRGLGDVLKKHDIETLHLICVAYQMLVSDAENTYLRKIFDDYQYGDIACLFLFNAVWPRATNMANEKIDMTDLFDKFLTEFLQTYVSVHGQQVQIECSSESLILMKLFQSGWMKLRTEHTDIVLNSSWIISLKVLLR